MSGAVSDHLVRTPPRHRRLPVGAESQPGGGVDFRVWAPHAGMVEVVIEDASGVVEVPLEREPGGYWSMYTGQAEAGSQYRYRLDGRGPFPDLASRYQPQGPHGSSEVIDPAVFAWTDDSWKGIRLRGQ